MFRSLTLALLAAPTISNAQGVSITGTVVDSLSWAPIADARVSIAAAQIATRTDASGRFTATVPPGRYRLQVQTASLDSIGVGRDITIDVAPGMTHVRVAVPSAAQIVARLCPNIPSDAAGIILGRVSVRGDSVIPSDVSITASWRERVAPDTASTLRTRETRSEPNGTFSLCGVPLGTPLTVRGRDGELRASVAFHLTPARRLGRLDIRLEPVTGTARFAGLVVADSSREPLSNVEVALPGLGKATRTNAKGEFRIGDVQPGEHDVVIRRLGYAPVEARLEFLAGETVRRAIPLSAITILDSVLVNATRPANLVEFEQNRSLGFGEFFTRADIDRAQGRRTGDILALARGIKLVQKGSGTAVAVSNHNMECYSQVYVNGLLVSRATGRDLRSSATQLEPFDVNTIPIETIEAIEFYAGTLQVPARYMSVNSQCGVLVIHTRAPSKPPTH